MSRSTAFAECRSCLCLSSRRAARGISAVYDRHLRPHGLRNTQFTILTALLVAGDLPVTELARELGVERTTLTRNLGVLEANGWVEIGGDPDDARSRLVSVTPAGEAIARQALPSWRRAQQAITTALGGSGVAALHRLANTPLP